MNEEICVDEEKIYVDEKGYERFTDTDALVHRYIAYYFIYLPNEEKYPLGFADYVVHHKDENKRNNAIDNLKILTKEEHDKIHGINRIHEEEYLDDYF